MCSASVIVNWRCNIIVLVLINSITCSELTFAEFGLYLFDILGGEKCGNTKTNRWCISAVLLLTGHPNPSLKHTGRETISITKPEILKQFTEMCFLGINIKYLDMNSPPGFCQSCKWSHNSWSLLKENQSSYVNCKITIQLKINRMKLAWLRVITIPVHWIVSGLY